MKIDVLIPSLRPDRLNNVLKSLETEHKHDIKITTDTETKGLYKAVNKMFSETDGEIIFHIPDDIVVEKGCIDSAVDKLLEGYDIVISRARISRGESKYHGYFGLPFSSFPLVRRSFLDKRGYLFDPKFNCFYGDPDLSMYCWFTGGKIGLSEDSWVGIDNPHDEVKINNCNNFEKIDEAYFIDKWGDIFGEFELNSWDISELRIRLDEQNISSRPCVAS